MNKALLFHILFLSFFSQAQNVIPRPLVGRPKPALQMAEQFEMQLLKNEESNLFQYEFNTKSNLNPAAQSFEQIQTPRSLKSQLSQAEANKIFQFISQQKGIPFENLILSYCFDRAQAVARLLEINGIDSQKIFADGLFIFDSPLSRTGKVRWNSHVAVTIQVVNDLGVVETQVIDPSLAKQLLTLPKWFELLTQYTALGCSDGSGQVYGTGQDGCVFQVKNKYHYNRNDFSQDLQTWDLTNWKTTVDLMKVYAQAQLIHGK